MHPTANGPRHNHRLSPSSSALIQEDPLVMACLHDRVLTLITAKTYAQLNDLQGKETFRNEIRDEINPILKKGKVKEVLFSDFVVE